HGEKIAIVGANGAGKTTLVKLLLRLYDSTKGDIYYNEQPYKQINPCSLRKKVGAVFQNPEVYSVTIGENVLLKPVETKEEEELVIQALKFSGLYEDVMHYDDGIHTLVTREFQVKGAIFSGGQIQKLAIARGYAQNYQLFILDEPSSSLDPLAEAALYQNMLKLGKDKTLLFISHRLSTTINCDYIYLFENGSIIESGKHHELMQLKGKYCDMFNSQSEKYLGGEQID
ncbi:MAG: ATP-binding cassette domain-containing protein, partial [Bacilli bacterium]